jgi:hypothetical protein
MRLRLHALTMQADKRIHGKDGQEPVPISSTRPCSFDKTFAIGVRLSIAHGEVDHMGKNEVVVETHALSEPLRGSMS